MWTQPGHVIKFARSWQQDFDFLPRILIEKCFSSHDKASIGDSTVKNAFLEPPKISRHQHSEAVNLGKRPFWKDSDWDSPWITILALNIRVPNWNFHVFYFGSQFQLLCSTSYHFDSTLDIGSQQSFSTKTCLRV